MIAVDPARALLLQIERLEVEVKAMETDRMLPHGTRVVFLKLAEDELAALGAARVPPLTRADSIAVGRQGNSGYRALAEFHELISAKEAEIANLRAQL